MKEPIRWIEDQDHKLSCKRDESCNVKVCESITNC